MSIRVLFVPFNLQSESSNAPGHDYADKNRAWKERYVGPHSVHSLFYKPGFISPVLAGLNDAGQVYIRGHSLTGFAGVFDHANLDESGEPLHPAKMNKKLKALIGVPDVKFSLKAKEVVNRLIESGLRPTFSGKIKCYNCHSGEGDPNFATEVSRHLWAKDYRQCAVFGYRGALQPFHEEVGGKKLTDNGQTAKQRRMEIPRGP
ncbi:hypothetical protein [Gemmatimonas sp.]|uniref:hypothetical protein n=1 Tax=Gemmatimonas sp. TaxID=1962908 RepID=UPI00286B06B2|nr:hypothetical protein [Gemmatimonas sp.]